MTEEIPTKKRLNITLTNGNVDEIEQLRAMLERRLLQRLSLAQVIKRITKHALAEEAKLAVDIERLTAFTNQNNS